MLDGVPARLAAHLAEIGRVLSGAAEMVDLNALMFTLGDNSLIGAANLNSVPEQSVLRADELLLSPQAKSLDLYFAVSVTLSGKIENPTFGLDESDAGRRLASLLGSTIFPPAALGAFVDFGSSETNACLALAANPQRESAVLIGKALKAVKSGIERVGRELRNLAAPHS
jgi:hypothetical protein